jgi:hypothetical protein
MTDTGNLTPIQSKPIHEKRTKPTMAKRAPKASAPISKSEIVVKLLARRNGASVADISGATGWQAHSIRAFFSGLRRKGAPLMREARMDGTSRYRLVSPDGPQAQCDPPVVVSIEVPRVVSADDIPLGE